MASTHQVLSPPTSRPRPPPRSSFQSDDRKYDVARDMKVVSELPASRVNAAITRMLNGVRLSSTLWSETGGISGGHAGHGGSTNPVLARHERASPRTRPLDTNMYGNYYDSTSSARSRLLQRYSERGYEGIHQPKRAVSLRQKSEHANQRLKECLVDEVADNLREQLGLLHLGVAPGRSASGSLASFNRAINERENQTTKRPRSSDISDYNTSLDYTDNASHSWLAEDGNQLKVEPGEGTRERKEAGASSFEGNRGAPKGDNIYTVEGSRSRRVNPQGQPRESDSFGGVTSVDGKVYNRSSTQRQDTDSQKHANATASPLYILHDEGAQVRSANTNNSKQRRTRPRSMPPMEISPLGVDQSEALTGHREDSYSDTHFTSEHTPSSHTMEYIKGEVSDPSTQFLAGRQSGNTTHHGSSADHPASSSANSSRSRTRYQTKTETTATGGEDHNTPAIRGVPQSPSQTTLMIRDKRIPPMPSGRPPPLPQHLRDDINAENNESTMEEDEIELDSLAQEDKAVEELGVVPDGVNKNHLPLLRAKKVFEKELAVRLEKKMENEDQLLGDLRICMEKPSLREKVESTIQVVQDVIKTNITKDRNGNKIYSVVLDLGRFHRKVKHDIKDFVVEIEGSTFGSPETVLSKVISIEFPETVEMEQLVLRQFGPTIEMDVPFKPNQLMNDLIDLVSKNDQDNEQQSKVNGVTSRGSLSSDQNSMSSCEQEEEQPPPELPVSPPPPLTIKKPKPMRRRRRSTLESNSSESISSVVGNFEKLSRTATPEVGIFSANNTFTKTRLDTNADQNDITVMCHTQENGHNAGRKVGEMRCTAQSDIGNGPSQNGSRSKNNERGKKSITVDQTTRVYAPEETTQAKLEFDGDDFFTIKHISMHDDKSETDSDIVMDKKSLNTESVLQKPVYVVTQHKELHSEMVPKTSSVVTENSQESSIGEKNIGEEAIETEFNRHLEPLNDTGIASDKSVSLSFPVSESNDSFVSGDSSTDMNDTGISIQSIDSVVCQLDTDPDLEYSLLITEKPDGGTPKESSNMLERQSGSNSDSRLDIVKKNGSTPRGSGGATSEESAKKENAFDKDSEQMSTETTNFKNEGEADMVKYETVVMTLAPTPHRNSAGVGMQPNTLFTATNSAGSEEKANHKKDTQNHKENTNIRVALDKTTEPCIRSRRRSNEEKESSGMERKDGPPEIDVQTEVEEYVRPKRKSITKNTFIGNENDGDTNAILPHRLRQRREDKKDTKNEQVSTRLQNDKDNVNEQRQAFTSNRLSRENENDKETNAILSHRLRRRRERGNPIIKKAQSLSDSVPVGRESNVEAHVKQSGLRSDLFRRKSEDETGKRVDLSKPSYRFSLGKVTHSDGTKESPITSQPPNYSEKTKSAVVMRKKPQESQPRFLRSKADSGDLIELRRKRYSLDPGKLHRKFDSDFDVRGTSTGSVTTSKGSSEVAPRKHDSQETEQKLNMSRPDASPLQQTKRLSFDSMRSLSRHQDTTRARGTSKAFHDGPSSDNERVNRLRQMFEGLGKGNSDAKSQDLSRRKSIDQPGNTPPHSRLHRNFKSEFTLNL